MGYRLFICNKSRSLDYSTVGHYGVSLDYREKSSYKYLVSIGKLDQNQVFRYDGCIGPEEKVELTKDEFNTFIELYSKDYSFLFEYKNGLLNQTDIISLMNNDENKLLDWG